MGLSIIWDSEICKSLFFKKKLNGIWKAMKMFPQRTLFPIDKTLKSKRKSLYNRLKSSFTMNMNRRISFEQKRMQDNIEFKNEEADWIKNYMMGNMEPKPGITEQHNMEINNNGREEGNGNNDAMEKGKDYLNNGRNGQLDQNWDESILQFNILKQFKPKEIVQISKPVEPNTDQDDKVNYMNDIEVIQDQTESMEHNGKTLAKENSEGIQIYNMNEFQNLNKELYKNSIPNLQDKLPAMQDESTIYSQNNTIIAQIFKQYEQINNKNINNSLETLIKSSESQNNTNIENVNTKLTIAQQILNQAFENVNNISNESQIQHSLTNSTNIENLNILPKKKYKNKKDQVRSSYILNTGVEKEGSSEKGLYKCEKCGNAYARLHSLSRHIKFECGVLPKFECFICHKKSKHKHNLLLHMKTHLHK